MRSHCPDFQLDVTGTFNYAPRLTKGITYKGFVDNLQEVYENAGFFICPVFGGTGQQVKIVEAMAHGLPVVALKDAADKSPLRHEENGYIADTEDEFAEYVVRLWQDRSLCRRLGQEARTTVAKEFSRERLVSGLAALL
jgi:glycosyltransferase involved in cell wall biosynthesis